MKTKYTKMHSNGNEFLITEDIRQIEKTKILAEHVNHQNHYRLIELGAGDGTKTKYLLKYLMDQKVNFTIVQLI